MSDMQVPNVCFWPPLSWQYDNVETFEYELPEDFEDEDIDSEGEEVMGSGKRGGGKRGVEEASDEEDLALERRATSHLKQAKRKKAQRRRGVQNDSDQSESDSDEDGGEYLTLADLFDSDLEEEKGSKSRSSASPYGVGEGSDGDDGDADVVDLEKVRIAYVPVLLPPPPDMFSMRLYSTWDSWLEKWHVHTRTHSPLQHSKLLSSTMKAIGGKGVGSRKSLKSGESSAGAKESEFVSTGCWE